MIINDAPWPVLAAGISSSIVLLPIGALEAHGPHLPIGTDSIISTFFAKQIGALPGVASLPILSYGCKTDPNRVGGEFPGAFSLSISTMSSVIYEVMTACSEHGVTKFILWNSHMANIPPMVDAAQRFRKIRPEAKILIGAWWDFAREDTRNRLAHQFGVPRDIDHHAAFVETSLALAIVPELVNMRLLQDDNPTRLIRYIVLPPPPEACTKAGTVFNSIGASKEVGLVLLSEILEDVKNTIRAEFFESELQ